MFRLILSNISSVGNCRISSNLDESSSIDENSLLASFEFDLRFLRAEFERTREPRGVHYCDRSYDLNLVCLARFTP